MWLTDCSRTRSSLVAASSVDVFFGPWKVKQKITSCHTVRDDGKSVEVEPTTDTRKDRVPLRISRVFLVELFISYRGWSSTRRAWRYTSMDACLSQKSIKGWDGPYPHSDLELRYTYLCGFLKICWIFTTTWGDLMWQAHVWNHQVDKADRLFIVQPITAGPRHRVACVFSWSWCLYTFRIDFCTVC